MTDAIIRATVQGRPDYGLMHTAGIQTHLQIIKRPSTRIKIVISIPDQR